MSDSNLRPTWHIDWGHLLTVMAMAAWTLWYLVDLRSVSLDLENTLMVQPLSIALLVMLAAVIPQCIRRTELPKELRPEPLERKQFLKVLGLMLAFAALVGGMFTIGFDISVFSFCVIALLLGGERRWWVIVLFSALAAVVMIKGYQLLVPFQMPNVLLK
jgi:putative tricarboxylic transport membrane protein